MNWKRYVLASLAVFFACSIMEILIHGVALKSLYEASRSIWRTEADMQSKQWIMPVVGVFTSFVFTYLFAVGYEGKGIKEGVRFGALIGFYTALPMAFITYAVLPMPYELAVGWFVFAVIETILAGMLASIVYRPATAHTLTARA